MPSKSKSMRMHLSICPGTPAYNVLSVITPLKERRATAIGLMNVAAALASAKALDIQSTSTHSGFAPAPTDNRANSLLSSKARSPIDVLLDDDFSNL